MSEFLVQIGTFTFRTIKRKDGTYESIRTPSDPPSIPQVPTLLPVTLPQPSNNPEWVGIELPNLPKGSKVLGKFESNSSPGDFHYIIQSETGYLYCTCTGFGVRKTCWHYELIKELGPEKFTIPITIKGGKKWTPPSLRTLS